MLQKCICICVCISDFRKSSICISVGNHMVFGK